MRSVVEPFCGFPFALVDVRVAFRPFFEIEAVIPAGLGRLDDGIRSRGFPLGLGKGLSSLPFALNPVGYLLCFPSEACCCGPLELPNPVPDVEEESIFEKTPPLFLLLEPGGESRV